MIYALALFISASAPPIALRSSDTFPTMAACEARLAADMPRLEAARAQAEASLGYPLRLVARCVQQGVGT
jgi:hypothetical protein